MFCEKCGNPLPEGSRFCEKCGAPIAQPENAPTAAPAEAVQAPVQNPVPTDNAPFNAVQSAPVEPMPAPAEPKKPMSPKTKKIIMFSAIGAGALAVILVALFVFILPAIDRASRLDLTKYATLNFYGIDDDSDEAQSIVDGSISGYLSWDYEKFAEDQNLTEEKAEDVLYGFTSGFETEYKFNGEEGSSSFDDAKADDSFTVTLKMPSAEKYGISLDADKMLEEYEKRVDIKVKHETMSRTFKISDILKEKNVETIKPVEADVLAYIKENNLVTTTGTSDGELTPEMKAFETKFGDFTFKLSEGSETVMITDKNGNNYGEFDLEGFSSYKTYYDGETAEIDYNSYDVSSLENKGITLTGDPIEYTITVPEGVDKKVLGLSLDNAKANLESLKTFFLDEIGDSDYSAKSGDKFEIKNIYYSAEKSGDDAYVSFVYYNATQKYYKVATIETDSLMLEGDTVKSQSSYVYFRKTSSNKDMSKAVEDCSYINKKSADTYTVTKLA